MRHLKIFSFFSGSGFLDLGFELAGFQIELVNEFSPAFMNAYKYSREQMGLRKPAFGYANIDINQYLTEKKSELTNQMSVARSDGSLIGFIGGPPCPDFSVAGKQKGRNGDNGKLSQSYVDLIIAQRPDFFLFENVKGLWRTAKHRAFYEELKSELSAAGYQMTERLTNALEFGAPQDRDRILLFGLHEDVINNVFQGNKDVTQFPWDKYRKYDLDEVKALPWPLRTDFMENSVSECPPDIPEELTVEYWFEKNDVTHHPNADDYFQPKAGRAKMEVIAEGDDSKKSYKRLHRWRYSPTVAYGNNEVHLHPYKIRRLSASEALSLQTLPKEFQLPAEMTLTDKFKTIGNGVPFLLSNGIAKTIRDFMEAADEENA